MRNSYVVCLAIVMSTLVMSADVAQDCTQDEEVPRKIAGCSEYISKSQGKLSVAYYLRALAYRAAHPELALADLSKAIDLDPKNMAAQIMRGDLYRVQSQYEKAAADYEQALNLVEVRTAQEPEPRTIALGKSLRELIREMNDRAKLEHRWVEYLKKIQSQNNYSNWSSKPYDAYLDRVGK